MKFDKRQVSLDAKRLRKQYGIETAGIDDIFSFVLKQNIELIRYPFGKNMILGFATTFEGKKVIVSNSSEILSREIYTVAHELGHIIYDFSDSINTIKIDQNDEEKSISEERAYYFADCLLMPEDKIQEILNDNFNKKGSELLAINIVQMQLEFGVSYSAILERLHSIGIITQTKKNYLYKERDNYTSKTLFRMLGEDETLLNPANKLVVPPKYIDYVISNYTNEYIPFSKMKSAFDLVDIDTSNMHDKEKNKEEESLDDLFEEYI